VLHLVVLLRMPEGDQTDGRTFATDVGNAAAIPVVLLPLSTGRMDMIGAAITFLIIGLIAALLGFTTIAGASFAIAKFIFVIAIIIFVVLLVLGLKAGKAVVDKL